MRFKKPFTLSKMLANKWMNKDCARITGAIARSLAIKSPFMDIFETIELLMKRTKKIILLKKFYPVHTDSVLFEKELKLGKTHIMFRDLFDGMGRANWKITIEGIPLKKRNKGKKHRK